MIRRPRLMLADDNPLVLDVVERMLKKQFVITGSCADGDSVLRDVSSLKPDVVILDISMGDTNGFDVARQLKEMNCPAKVVFLSVHEDLEFVRAAAEVGALAYVCKSSIDNDLVDAIYSATVNKRFFPILFASDL